MYKPNRPPQQLPEDRQFSEATIYFRPQRGAIFGLMMITILSLLTLLSGSASNSGLLITVGASASVVFGGILIYYLVRAAKKTPALIINKDGVQDLVFNRSLGLIRWEAMKYIGVVRVMGKEYLSIEVEGYDKLVAEQKISEKKQKEIHHNRSMGLKDINIALHTIAATPEILVQIIDHCKADRQVNKIEKGVNATWNE